MGSELTTNKSEMQLRLESMLAAQELETKPEIGITEKGLVFQFECERVILPWPHRTLHIVLNTEIICEQNQSGYSNETLPAKVNVGRIDSSTGYLEGIIYNPTYLFNNPSEDSRRMCMEFLENCRHYRIATLVTCADPGGLKRILREQKDFGIESNECSKGYCGMGGVLALFKVPIGNAEAMYHDLIQNPRSYYHSPPDDWSA